MSRGSGVRRDAAGSRSPMAHEPLCVDERVPSAHRAVVTAVVTAARGAAFAGVPVVARAWRLLPPTAPCRARVHALPLERLDGPISAAALAWRRLDDGAAAVPRTSAFEARAYVLNTYSTYSKAALE
eukprot:80959-Prymnesium_polylepis.1